MTPVSLNRFGDIVPPLTSTEIQRHRFDSLQHQITELQRENAKLIEGQDLLWEQIANLRAQREEQSCTTTT